MPEPSAPRTTGYGRRSPLFLASNAPARPATANRSDHIKHRRRHVAHGSGPGDGRYPQDGLQISINRIIKQVKRVGCGFTNMDNYRRRIMAHIAVTRPRLQAA